MPIYKGIAVFLESDTTDTRLTRSRSVPAVFTYNSLENLSRIQLISRKFSREFRTNKADMEIGQGDTGICRAYFKAIDYQ